jgi:hypothetical protein
VPAKNGRLHGNDMTVPFLKNGFAGNGRAVRRDDDGCFLLRTPTTSFPWIETLAPRVEDLMFVVMQLVLFLSTDAADKDYQQLADIATWTWKAEEATAFHSMLQARCNYQIELAKPKNAFGHDLVVRFSDADKVVFSLQGTASTVFAVQDNVVYIAEFHPSASGCGIIAFDLKAGKQLWKTPLKGLGPIPHFRYSNRVSLQLEDGAVRVFGNESAGKYIEYVSLKTGKTVGHRLFK